MRIRDGKNSDPGTEIDIPDPQHCLKVKKKTCNYQILDPEPF